MMLTHQNDRQKNQKETDYLEHQLIEEILQVTHSTHSVNFYKKSIRELGWERVRMHYREVAGWMDEGKKIDPAKVLTSELKKAMGESGTNDNNHQNKDSCYPTRDELFNNFSQTKALIKQEENGKIDYPFPAGKRAFPTPTFVSPLFFTVSSNKLKSDRVIIPMPISDGERIPMEVLRGKRQAGKEAEELGLLNSEHSRILKALHHIWVEQGCRIKGGLCFCLASVYRVAQLLGWKKYGGSALVHLTDKISHLESRSFYIVDTGVEFKFLTSRVIESKEKIPRKYLEIYFSAEHSEFLRNKWTVSRSIDSLAMKSEVGTFLQDYLEPILISKYPKAHKIELINLIDELNLPPALWHGEKWRRREQFMKAIREVNKNRTADGRYFDLRIEQGSNPNDFMLVARLTHRPISYVDTAHKEKRSILKEPICNLRYESTSERRLAYAKLAATLSILKDGML